MSLLLFFPAVKCAEWTAPTLIVIDVCVSVSVYLSACCQDSANLPEGASTPALGLSNKAIFQGEILALHLSVSALGSGPSFV